MRLNISRNTLYQCHHNERILMNHFRCRSVTWHFYGMRMSEQLNRFLGSQAWMELLWSRTQQIVTWIERKLNIRAKPHRDDDIINHPLLFLAPGAALIIWHSAMFYFVFHKVVTLYPPQGSESKDNVERMKEWKTIGRTGALRCTFLICACAISLNYQVPLPFAF